LGLTKKQVAGVRARREQSTVHYDSIFDEIDALSQAGAVALARSDYAELGRLMNICHGLLNAIEVSTAELENMVSIARAAGAVGAKVTGAGGGGSIVALCPGSVAAVSDALEAGGFRTLSPG
jgi:hydroxymethylglutaryl-CoA reductase